MSNCLDISEDTGCLGFGPELMDIKKFLAFTEEFKTKTQEWCRGFGINDPEHLKFYIFSWFIDGAWRQDGDGIVIHLGKGSSSHTFRDFHQTLMVICDFINGGVAADMTFEVLDDDNPHDGWMSYPFTFSQSNSFRNRNRR